MRGWQAGGGWTGPNSCVARQLDRVDRNQPDDEVRLRADGGVTARLVRSRFATSNEAGRTMFDVQQAINECDDGPGTGYLGFPSPDEVRTYTLGTGDRRSFAFFVLAGDRLSVFLVVGAAEPSALDAGPEREAVAEALYRDLRAW